MQVTAAFVEHGAEIVLAASHCAHFLVPEQSDRHAAADALLRGRSDAGCGRLVIGRAQRAVLPRLAGDLVATYQVEREVRGTVGKIDPAAAEVGTEISLDPIRVMLQPRIELPAIVARR